MDNKIIDGISIANSITKKLKKTKLKHNKKLIIVQVGSLESSNIYIKKKLKMSHEIGIKANLLHFNSNITTEYLIQEISKLNEDQSVGGYIIQLPLPKNINQELVFKNIDPKKDVDCFCDQNKLKSPMNLAIKNIVEYENIELENKKILVIGRGKVVGETAYENFKAKGFDVDVIDSHTENNLEKIKVADIIVIGIGQAKWLKASMVKENVIILDAGINRLENGSVVGDADFEELLPKVQKITPVPGGIGPLTVVCLFESFINMVSHCEVENG